MSKIKDISNKRTQEKKEDKKGAAKKEKNNQGIADLDQHRISWNELYSRLEVKPDITTTGLTDAEAKARLMKYGENTLTEKVKVPWYMQIIHEWIQPFSLMLWAGGILCFIAYGLDPADPSNLYLGIVLLFVVMLTGIVTYLQNAKSDSLMASFKNFIPPQCNVIRDGKTIGIQAKNVTLGDIVLVKAGERVPADLRIIESKEMKVDNSSLTGESDPLLRSPECTEPQKILETKNVAFFGTMVPQGYGKGIVFNIGDNTIIGKIANLADSAEAGDTPLRIEIDRFIMIISIIAVSLGIFFFCAGFILKYTVIQNIVFAIGIIVANVPEGLLATVTICLSVSASKLSKRKVLVKNLESVETLGSTSCICSDKTGTLTQNKMTIENLFFNLKIVKGHNREKEGPNFKYLYDPTDPTFIALRECASVNSSAFFSETMNSKNHQRIESLDKKAPDYQNKVAQIEKEWLEELSKMKYSERPVNGDASETAIIKFYQPWEDISEVRKRHPLGKQKDGADAQVPFNSAHKFQIKVVEKPKAGSHWTVFFKGAPERVWDKCTHVLVNGKEVAIGNQEMDIIQGANITFAKGGQRVLGFAQYNLPIDKYPKDHKFDFKGAFDLDIPLDKLVFVGLMSIIDPPRDTVPGAIQKCKTAGIKVIMVTGDHQLTAAAIARQIGIFEGESNLEMADRLKISKDEATEKSEAIVINGDMLTQAELEDRGLPESEKGKKLERWLKKEQIVFARTSPEQKLYIVKGCQKLDYIVAVTGDGVNDSPAIKQADIGIAMGITGSDVAKDSADMILLNDDFSAIILGIEEGRKIFDNLKKSIAYILASNIPEIIPFLLFIIIQIPIPLSTVLILCVDLGTDLFPGISMAYEEAELDILTRMPRPK
jgi:sodium/potassium-transporting ATPase subunit alpha